MSRQPCLIPDVRENAFYFSLLGIMLATGLLDTAFVVLSYVFSVAGVLRAFYRIEVLNCVKGFSHVYCVIVMTVLDSV